MPNQLLGLFVLVFVLWGCGSSNSQPETNDDNGTVLSDDQGNSDQGNADAGTTLTIAVNQLGFNLDDTKIGIVSDTPLTEFSLVSASTGETVFSGPLSEAKSWQAAGGKHYKTADFSQVTTNGNYVLKVGDLSQSEPFLIDNNVYGDVNDAALKYYYYNRSSAAIEMPYTQTHVRASGHPDTSVKVHRSAASQHRPEGTVIESSKGWYDAGDYGKYIVNAGITTFTLLTAFDHFRPVYIGNDIGIPESADGLPDILNEIQWNIDWMASMQDLDGGVYHKLTTLQWPGKEMPNQDNRQRYVIGKSTSATLNFAATMAAASRIFGTDYMTVDQQSNMIASAEQAWQWAVENPNAVYVQPSDVTSGEYGDSYFGDEFAWAAAELFLATNKSLYLEYFVENQPQYTIPSWQNVSSLALVSMLTHSKDKVSSELYQSLESSLMQLVNNIASDYQNSAFATVMQTPDFVWGSNSAALNKSLLLIQAYRLTHSTQFKVAAMSSLSYVLGRNPTGYSFVTGFGSQPAMFPHHRISESDGVIDPIPGMVVGGPQPGMQDGCNYPSTNPAEAFVDDWCSYASNEIAINWNAPLVYLLGFTQSENVE